MANRDSSPPSRGNDDVEFDDGIASFVDEIASSRLVGDALTRLVDAGERVVHAQQTVLSAVGLPSASQFEGLTLRVRTLFHRIEELEDDIDRLERRISALETKTTKTVPRATGAGRSGTK